MTTIHIAALRNLRLGVEMDRHCLPDGDAKLAALDAAIAALGGQSAAVAPDILRQHAEVRIEHLNRGMCPDAIQGHESRDPDCPVCRALEIIDATVPANTRQALLALADRIEQAADQPIAISVEAARAIRAALAAPAAPHDRRPLTGVFVSDQAVKRDNEAVDRFAIAMKDKLAQARAKGRGGWQSCEPADLSRMLREHVEKGDPRDVAAFCMFLWSLGHPISAAPAEQAQPSDDDLGALADAHRWDTHTGRIAMLRAALSRYGSAPQAGEDARPLVWMTQDTYVRLMDGRTGATVPVHVGRTRTARIPLHLGPQPAAQAAPAVPREQAAAIREAARNAALDAYFKVHPGMIDTLANCRLFESAFDRGFDAAPTVPLLAAEHKGMRVDYSGMLTQASNALVIGAREPGLAEMLRQLREHLTDLGLRWYAGDTASVDELCQLYCIAPGSRAALTTQGASHAD